MSRITFAKCKALVSLSVLIAGASVVLFAFSSVAGTQEASREPLPITYIADEDIQAALNRGTPQAAANPQPNIRIVDAGGYNVAVSAIHRPAGLPGVAAVHFKVAEVYHVLAGTATFVIGGTLVNAKTRSPDSVEDGPGASGTAIKGGLAHRLKPGDVIIIPAGTPHWFSKVEGSFSYIVVRIDPSRVLALK